MKLIDTTITYDDGSKSKRYTDTGNIETARFKAVPYEWDGNYREKHYIVYKRCPSGLFGDYLSGKKIKHKTLKSCIEEIEQYLKPEATK